MERTGSSDAEGGNANSDDSYDRAMGTLHGDQSQALMPLFQDGVINGLDEESDDAGEDEKEQMQCIMEVKGEPPRSMIVVASRRKQFFDEDYKPIQTPNTKGKVRHPNMSKDDQKISKFQEPESPSKLQR